MQKVKMKKIQNEIKDKVIQRLLEKYCYLFAKNKVHIALSALHLSKSV